MHDPYSVAHEIRFPWFRTVEFGAGRMRMWGMFITIWHRDPCRGGGGDDSCGWFAPRLTERQLSRIDAMAHSEARDLWFRKAASKKIESAAEAEALMRGAIVVVARSLGVRVSMEEATRWACEMVHAPFDNYRSSLAYLPGYHGNNVEDADYYWRTDVSRSLFSGVARWILRERRPWWRHPRWHVHHWRIQVHPWQQVCRWFRNDEGHATACSETKQSL